MKRHHDPYELADEAIRAQNRVIIREFARLKNIMSFDELNVLDSVRKVYEYLDATARRRLLKLARDVYDDEWAWLLSMMLVQRDDEAPPARVRIQAADISKVLNEYNPVTQYVYIHEVERKRARCAEAMIAARTSGARNEAVRRAMRLWANMQREYADEVTYQAAQDALRDAGVERVMWVTVHDERRCGVCGSRDGRIYEIDRVPPRPHYGCRCVLVPA